MAVERALPATSTSATSTDPSAAVSVRGVRGPARREALLDAAEVVVLRDGPDASMAAIAAEAGVTKPVVYRVFGSKGGLYLALVERHAGVLLERLQVALHSPGSWTDRTLAAVDAYLSFLQERPDIYLFLQHSDEAGEANIHSHVATLERTIVEVLDRGLRADLRLPPEGSFVPTIWANAIVGMVHQVGDWWLATDTAMPRAALAAQISTMVTGGIAAARTRRDTP